MAYTFDGVNKVITLSSGTVSVSVRDLYSRWVDWFITLDLDNQKYLPAFLTIGGDVINASTGTSIPIYAFLLNGWRIKPQNADHTLEVIEGILLVDGGGDPFLSTDGGYTVRVNYQQPVQAITVNTGGGGGSSYSLNEIAAAVWGYSNKQLTDKPATPADVMAAVFAK